MRGFSDLVGSRIWVHDLCQCDFAFYHECVRIVMNLSPKLHDFGQVKIGSRVLGMFLLEERLVGHGIVPVLSIVEGFGVLVILLLSIAFLAIIHLRSAQFDKGHARTRWCW